MISNTKDAAFVNFTMTNPSDGDTPETCGICRDDMVEGVGLEHRVNDQASHRFHTECVKPWFEQHPSCPLCRDRVTSINGEPLINDPAGSEAPAFFGPEAPPPIVELAVYGDIATARLLLSSGTISEEHQGWALVAAAGAGRIDMARIWLSSGTISEEHQGSALIAAAYRGHIDMARLLLSSGTISEQDQGSALIAAAGAGHIDMARLLLSSGTISEENRRRAAKYAIDNGHYRIAALLFSSWLAKTATDAAPAIAAAGLAAAAAMSYTYFANQESKEQA